MLIRKFLLNFYHKRIDEGRNSPKKKIIHKLGLLHDSARYRFAGKYVKNKKVINLACGYGYGSKILKDMGAKEVYGIDIDKKCIKYAKKEYMSEECKFFLQNSEQLKFDNNFFDAVVSIETIEHLKNPEEVLKEIKRVAKADSLVIISTPNGTISKKAGINFSKYHIKEYTTKEMINLLSKYFEVKEIYHQMPFRKKKKWLAMQILFSFFLKYNQFEKRNSEISGVETIFICKNHK